MSRCDYCGYYYSDCDKYGFPQGNDYCHYIGPDEWAPCEQEGVKMMEMCKDCPYFYKHDGEVDSSCQFPYANPYTNEVYDPLDIPCGEEL